MAAKKQAKVYDAGESPEQIKPTVTRTSHKECSPGEFGAMVAKATEKQALLPNTRRLLFTGGERLDDMNVTGDLARMGGIGGATVGALYGALNPKNKKKRLRAILTNAARFGAMGAAGGAGTSLGAQLGAALGSDVAGGDPGPSRPAMIGGGAGIIGGGVGGGMLAQQALDALGIKDEDDNKKKKKEKTAADFGAMMAKQSAGLGGQLTNMANSAIQSRPGQAVLGGASHLYNNYAPQGVRNFVSQQMPTYYGDEQSRQILQQGGVKNLAPRPFQTQEATQGSYIDTATTVENDNLVEDRIDSYAPATNFGTPLQQIGFGLAGGQLPGQTFKPNDTATHHTGIMNDSIVNDRLLPGKFDQQPATSRTPSPPMGKAGSAEEFGAMMAKLAYGGLAGFRAPPITGQQKTTAPNAQSSAVRLAQQNNINLNNVRGSGAGGMIMGSDIRRMTSGQPAAQARVSPQPAVAPVAPPARGGVSPIGQTAQATNAAAGSPAVQPSGATPEWQSLPPAELDARIAATRQRLGIDPTGGQTAQVRQLQQQPAPAAPAAAPTPARTGPIKAQGSAQRLAKQHGIDLNTVQGSGENGMIMGSDIRRILLEKGGSAYAFGALLGDMHIKTANKGLMNLFRRGVDAISGAAKPAVKAAPSVPVPPVAAKPTDAELFAQLGEVFKSKAPPAVATPTPVAPKRDWGRVPSSGYPNRPNPLLEPPAAPAPKRDWGRVPDTPGDVPIRIPNWLQQQRAVAAQQKGLAKELAVPPTKVAPPSPAAPAPTSGGQPGLMRENAVRRTGALMGQPAVPAVPGPSGGVGVAERLTPRDNQFGRAMDLLRAGGLAPIP